jgi:hypothetical protein
MIEIAPKSTEVSCNWEAAELYCQFLDHNGYNDWRLPTMEELKVIYDIDNDFTTGCYWSSTDINEQSPDYSKEDSCVWVISGDKQYGWARGFATGLSWRRSKDSDGFVRAVRDI